MAIGDGKVYSMSYPALGSAAIQPPSGEEWMVVDLGSSLMTSADGYPKSVSLGLYDGTLFSVVRNSSAGPTGWNRELQLFGSNAHYFRIADGAGGSGAAQNATISAIVTKDNSSAGRGDAKLAIASVPASGYLTAQPPSGETWSVREIGATAVDAKYGLPNVSFLVSDGTNNVSVYSPSPDSYTRPWNAVISNTLYARLQNRAGVTSTMSYIAIRMS